MSFSNEKSHKWKSCERSLKECGNPKQGKISRQKSLGSERKVSKKKLSLEKTNTSHKKRENSSVTFFHTVFDYFKEFTIVSEWFRTVSQRFSRVFKCFLC